MNVLMKEAISHFGQEIFRDLLEWYIFNGYVYIGEDAIILAQPHGYDELINSEKSLDKCNAWYVQYASGNKKRFFDVCPFELEWVIFERHGQKKRRAYKFTELDRRLNHGRTRYSRAKESTTSSYRG